MTLVIVQFTIPLLGFLALRDYYNGSLTKKDMLKGLKIATGTTGGILLLLLLIPGIAGSFLSIYESKYPEWLTTALISDRKNLLRGDSFRSLIFISAAAASLFGYATGKLKKEYSIMLIGVLTLFDLWGAGKRYLNADRFENSSTIRKTFNPTVADIKILEDKSYYRVLNLNVSTLSF